MFDSASEVFRSLGSKQHLTECASQTAHCHSGIYKSLMGNLVFEEAHQSPDRCRLVGD
jgi:hypothetical protein